MRSSDLPTLSVVGAESRQALREVPRRQNRKRTQGGAGVLMVQVDQADAILKAHGATAAGQLMLAINAALVRRLRNEDRVALVRDDGLLVVLPGVTARTIRRVEQRIVEAVRDFRLSVAGRLWSLSAQIGVACSPEGRLPGLSVPSLARLADDDLHRVLRQVEPPP
jgi:diguanylate cyclase (GGDEF)-like protein